MSDFYSSLRSTVVTPLLNKYGVSVVLRHVVKGAYNPATGGMGADTVTDYNCKGLFQAITQKIANAIYGSSTLKDSLVQKEDKMMLLSALQNNNVVLPFEPKAIEDFIVFNGITYGIVNVIPLAPSGTPVLYYIHIRK